MRQVQQVICILVMQELHYLTIAKHYDGDFVIRIEDTDSNVI